MTTTKYSLSELSRTPLDTASLEEFWGVRKLVTHTVETLAEAGDGVAVPITQVSASAIVQNRWLDTGTDSELIQSPQHIAARLSFLLSNRVLEAVGSADKIIAFGKGAIVGEAGELEHAAALTHTPYFASHLRDFFQGTAVISFADERAEAGDAITIPLCEKHTGTVRDYYQSVRVQISDAPRPDEIVLIAAASTGPRPFPRVGDRGTDQPIDISHMNGVFE